MTVLNKSYSSLPISKKEILRYLGSKEEDSVLTLLDECINEVEDKLTYKVCYCELNVKFEGELCDFEVFSFSSADLKKNLEGCRKAVVFASTVGVEIDRLITKYTKISPSKALILQAIGTERIEALCDAFCKNLGKVKPRFSPGYGDLPLTVQRDIFKILDCNKKIGLTLNDSLLMSPLKSVTAFVGIKER